MGNEFFYVWVIPDVHSIYVTDRVCIPVGGNSVTEFNTWDGAVTEAQRISRTLFVGYTIEYDNDAGRSIELQNY